MLWFNFLYKSLLIAFLPVSSHPQNQQRSESKVIHGLCFFVLGGFLPKSLEINLTFKIQNLSGIQVSQKQELSWDQGWSGGLTN